MNNEGKTDMEVTIANATYKLINVYKLQEWDEVEEKYIPVEDDQKATCSRCGRLHAKVYVVRRVQDGVEFTLGSGCVKKHLDGWMPEDAEVKRLAKEADALAKNKAHQKLVEVAMPIAQEVAALPIPEIIQVDTKHFTGRTFPVYGMRDSQIQIYCHEGLNDERRDCCKRAWKREQVGIRLNALYPPTGSTWSEDTNAKRRYKVQRIIERELEVW